MALTVGDRLGHYDVTALIGEGGMGQVYQATDTQLNRDVALKMLPDAFAADPDRLARFQREAQVLASLNHPGIAAIYGIEKSADTQALVLELVEGPTLADRIARGPIPIDEALPIAKQIAEALEAAHDAGVIHRDLKPANIKVREDGTVKVLDFGLAKALDTTPEGDPSQSPTLTAAATQMGVIMGTAAYMSPEQARGKPVDRRADIWAFGAVLFEILTGRAAFSGETVSDVIALVLQFDPISEILVRETPAPLSRLLRRCLEKDPLRRLRDIGDARVELEEALSAEPVPSAPIAADRPMAWRRTAAVALGGATVAALLAGFAAWYLLGSEPPRIVRFSLSDDAPFIAASSTSFDVAISPNGRFIAYLTGQTGLGGARLHVRALDRLASDTVVAEGELNSPFFSPDSEQVGFSDGSRGPVLKRVPVDGGQVSTICRLPGGLVGGGLVGAGWGADGTIVFRSNRSLWQVPAVGGEPARLTATADALWPELLPGNQAVLFTRMAQPVDDSEIMVLSLATDEQRVVLDGGTHARYLSSGHLVYGARRSLWAVPFDAQRLEVTGDPAPVQQGVLIKDPWGAVIPDSGSADLRTLVWVDREGREQPIEMPTRPYHAPRLSPDQSRIAVEVQDANTDVWLHDLERGTQTRLTTDPAQDRVPVWTPDGTRIAFGSTRASGRLDVFWKGVDGGPDEPLALAPDRFLFPWSFTPDGRRLLMNDARDITVVDVAGPQTDAPLLADPAFNEATPELSPDGRWLAYRSNETGRNEIYVRPYPDLERNWWQVSSEGGNYPAWSRDGGELFWRRPMPLNPGTTLGPCSVTARIGEGVRGEV